jgi:hypothetical protein
MDELWLSWLLENPQEITCEEMIWHLLESLREDTIKEIMAIPFETQAAILVADPSKAIRLIARLESPAQHWHIMLLLENRLEELHNALGGYLGTLSSNEELYRFWRGVWNSLNLEGRQNLRANALSMCFFSPEP